MPRITIREADLTAVSSAPLETEIVYVPGFATNDETYISPATRVDAGVPTLCSTIAEFEAYFGSIPAVFDKDQAYPAEFSEKSKSGVMFTQNSVDPSYVYARELINAGIPVLYERINDVDEEISVSKLYEVLSGADVGFNNLTDVGEYSVKYITSGGYPVFEYGGESIVTKTVSDIVFVPVTTPSEVTVNWAEGGQTVFLSRFDPSLTTLYTFNYVFPVGAEEGFWQYADSEIDLEDCGIEVQGTPTAGDSISTTITVTTSTTTSITDKMTSIASNRGDCVALIDHTNNPDRALTGRDSVYWAISDTESPYRVTGGAEYATMFTPWYTPAYVNISSAMKNTSYGSIDYNNVSWAPVAMPASFAYLTSLAYSVRNNPSWLAIAGISRGVVPNFVSLYISNRLTNAIAESYQPEDGVSINPITNIKPYGFTIWGNRTLRNNASGKIATSFLNIRNMVDDVKKGAYIAAKLCIFEQNTDIMWLNFKSQITPMLDKMATGYGLSNYKIIRNPSDDATKVVATIRLYPIYAVESFDITVELSNDNVSVE